MPQDARPPPELTSELADTMFQPAVWAQVVLELDLTNRQAQVARGLLLGEKEFTIAARLGISVHTVHHHRRWLYEKLDAHDYATAIRRLLDAALRAAERRAAPPNAITEKKGGRHTEEEEEEDQGTLGSA